MLYMTYLYYKPPCNSSHHHLNILSHLPLYSRHTAMLVQTWVINCEVNFITTAICRLFTAGLWHLARGPKLSVRPGIK